LRDVKYATDLGIEVMHGDYWPGKWVMTEIDRVTTPAFASAMATV
jgi:hypothetical protein